MSQTTLARVRAAEVPQITPDRATTVATAEYEALPALLRTLSQDDWLRATDCTGWTVRDVVAHLVGALDEGGTPDYLRSPCVSKAAERRLVKRGTLLAAPQALCDASAHRTESPRFSASRY
jgi:uncharacterized protein (TIGR03083 family)